MSCEYKCNFDGRKCNSGQCWNNFKCWCECKRRHLCEKHYIWNPATFNCGNGKYLASIVDNSAIMCDEIIQPFAKETKNIPANFNEKKATCKTQNFYILLTFSLITIALLIVVCIYCYLIKYWTKHLLQFSK